MLPLPIKAAQNIIGLFVFVLPRKPDSLSSSIIHWNWMKFKSIPMNFKSCSSYLMNSLCCLLLWITIGKAKAIFIDPQWKSPRKSPYASELRIYAWLPVPCFFFFLLLRGIFSVIVERSFSFHVNFFFNKQLEFYPTLKVAQNLRHFSPQR